MPADALQPSGHGFVSIVGAGPGPVDLMTLRAHDRLQRAEVVAAKAAEEAAAGEASG